MKRMVSLCLCVCIILSLCILPVSAAESWLWPIEGYYNISSGYGQRSSGWHGGIDIDSYGVGSIQGASVVASKSGTVSVYGGCSHNYPKTNGVKNCGCNGDAGNYVAIRHSDGTTSRYLHLGSIAVSNGAHVTQGTVIGYVGSTGYSTGYHLHFDISDSSNNRMNPMPVSSKHTTIGSSAPYSQAIDYIYSVGKSDSETGTSNGKPYISDTSRIIKYGQSGDHVRELQECLNYLDNAGLKADGKFGDATHTAVKNFQAKHGLAVDGDAGPKTLGKINELLDGHTCFETIKDEEKEAVHPHRVYQICICGKTRYTGNTATISTCSQCSVPGKPHLENMRDAYLTDNDGKTVKITFSWASTANTTHYNLYVRKKDGSGKYDEVHSNNHYAENGMILEFEEGEYKVQLQSTNSNADWVYTNSEWYYFEVKHQHEYTTQYESAHPHKQYKLCDCGDKVYTGNTRTVDGCNACHEHSYEIKYDSAHPHKQYKVCECGDEYATGKTREVSSCEICNPPAVKRNIKLQIGVPNMLVDGRETEIDPGRGTVPFTQNGRTLMPIRAVVETFGASVVWDETTQKVSIYADNTTIQLWIGSYEATVNGKRYTLDVAPVVVNGRTFMPLRFIAESLGLTVGWNELNQTITVEGTL